MAKNEDKPKFNDIPYKTIPALATYIDRIGAEQLNFRRFMVKEYRGNYYSERVLIKINPDGTISVSNKEYAPSKEEAELIKSALLSANFPKAMNARDTKGLPHRPGSIYYEFIDRRDGSIIMVQERCEPKAFPTWTYFSDGKWRAMEPDGGLPFYKPAKKTHNRIMIHEGAKAAKMASEIASGKFDNHPWREELADYEHWGIIGGALAPHRTDFSELRREKPSEVVYVCDNDFVGKSALREIARHYGGSIKGIMFDGHWPSGWDIADKMPESLFSKSGRYLGPSLSSLMRPATWATEAVPAPSGKGVMHVIRSAFKEEWLHSITPEVFIHRDWPNRMYGINEFNSWVAPFSDVDDTARILKKDAASKSAAIKYDPAKKPGLYGSASAGRFINTHSPSEIRAEKGDPKPFLDFMEHLITDEGDRTELLRWCATLIARPDTKMLYGCLLISEAQGVGKSTLGEKILAPLLGELNVSYPSEGEIVDSNYNYWLAHKRLAVVHEIYAGHSAKGYNRLKSVITDRFITVSKKYQANYEVENWLHVFACSNTKRALQLSLDDRRWFVPKVTEEKKEPSYWSEFNSWLSDHGGLSIIKWWAEQWLKKNAPVLRGDDAPWSAMKKEIIEESLSPGQTIVAQTLDAIAAEKNGAEILIADTDLIQLIQDELYDGRHNDRLEKPATIRKLAKKRGWHIGEKRAHIKAWGTSTTGPKLICSSADDAAASPGDLADAGRKLFNVREFANKHRRM